MMFELETRRCEVAQVTGTSVNLEHASAHAAPEVVVVCRTGAFVSRGFTGQLHGNQPAGIDERTNCPVHCCHAEPTHPPATVLEHFGRPEWPVEFLEHTPNRVTLSRLALHARNMSAVSVACRLDQ